jgi:hypothetical protein
MGRSGKMETNSNNQTDETGGMDGVLLAIDVRHMTEQQLAALGVSQVAYIKPVLVNGAQGFAIHAADGTPMAVAGDREIAVAAVLQHEMHPLSVH